MSSPTVLLPVRIPEMGPYLGKLVAGTGRAPGGLSLEAVRLGLVTRVFESAGAARRLAARDERDAALAAVGRVAWLVAWDEAVTTIAERLALRVDRRIEAEARAVRVPRRRRRRLALDAAERRALTGRLGAAGAPLVSALDALERATGPARAATGFDRAALEDWQDALKVAAQRLEASWLALEEAVAREAAYWERVADQVAAWRKPLWPVVVVGVLLLAGAASLGLVMGGYLAPPPWLADWWQAAFGP